MRGLVVFGGLIFFFFKQKTAYEMQRGLVGSEMCIRDRLNIDNHNRIPTTDCRKLRRSVRDYYYRGYSANETLSRWQSVRDGENKNIFPYQENADYIFNSGLTYELGCLKSHAYKELKKIPEGSPNYTEAQRLLVLLSFIKDIPEKLVPNNSILREFIGGSVFVGQFNGNNTDFKI
eukprot:TRINITY_DN22530_c0_g1_i1.p2 TRINITY_DN22530_c0_g1~~TRINITY_DN22530_c0_g1_i1.p2  ORF type:complete len:176 (-),score=29.84 TRINITY_DN22530_c0_g1_i1:347-874(-)